MSPEFTISTILEPADFEVRCQKFLDEVKELWRTKYPQLGIDTLNVTEHRIKGLPGTLNYISGIPASSLRKFMADRVVEASDREDRLSARRCVVAVNIKGEEAGLAQDVCLATEDIKHTAVEFGAEVVIEEVALDEFPLFAYLMLSFYSAGEEIPREDLI